MSKKYSKDEILTARAFLEKRGAEVDWWQFDSNLMTQIGQLFELTTNKNGVEVVKDPLIVATIIYGLIDYHKSGELPNYVENMLNESKSPLVKRIIQNIIDYGCEQIDKSYIRFYKQVKGGYNRWASDPEDV